MKLSPAAVLLPLLLACGCSKSDETPTTPAAPQKTPEELVKEMYAGIDALMARPEGNESEITVQHILVGVSGPQMKVKRTPGEAEELAAELFARARAGEDFDLLVKNYTNDTSPGIYPLVLSGGDQRNTYERGQMMQGFGDVAWRLAVGEIGVSPYDGGLPGSKPKNPYGFDILKRLK